MKNRLDHGPFSGRELVQLIMNGEADAEHGLTNMDSGERCTLEEHPDFRDFVLQYRRKKAAQDKRQALEQSLGKEKRGNAVKLTAVAAITVILAAGAITYLSTRPTKTNDVHNEGELADLYERGEMQITGSAGILPDPPRRAGHRSAQRGSGYAGSYEAAMQQVVQMGDASGSGGQQRLKPQQVASVMNRHIGSFGRCVGAEMRRGGRVGQVRVDMAIAGNGNVLGSSVRAGSKAFQQCVRGKLRRVRFPGFAAPRMGASYTFDAS